jgi:hypothetical protein
MISARVGGIAVALAALGAIAWSAGSQSQGENPDASAELTPDTALANVADAPAAPRRTPPQPKPITTDTPMAERVAVLGVLNKRNGMARDVALHPGQAARFGDLVVRLRACETTGDWEQEQLTGAFVQADKRGADGNWRRIFSGWLYKESPSLNVVEDPLYDVWPKSCTMRHPDMGPDTVAATSAPAVRPSAKKSADTPAPAPAAPSPSAESSSTT